MEATKTERGKSSGGGGGKVEEQRQMLQKYDDKVADNSESEMQVQSKGKTFPRQGARMAGTHPYGVQGKKQKLRKRTRKKLKSFT